MFISDPTWVRAVIFTQGDEEPYDSAGSFEGCLEV